MSSPDSMDPRDLDLLRRIEAGETAFYPAEGQRGDEADWLETVERLRRLATRRLIRMPEPHKTLLESTGRLPDGGLL